MTFEGLIIAFIVVLCVLSFTKGLVKGLSKTLRRKKK